MSGPDAVLSLVTLGVADLARSIAFYERLGFRRKAVAAQGVGFFQAGAAAFAVFPADELARDAGIPVAASAADSMPSSQDGGASFRGTALAWNCRSKPDVDAAIERARQAGAQVRKRPQDAFWGGYLGYFVDPDGHLWEVTYNPDFPLTEDGQLLIPD